MVYTTDMEARIEFLERAYEDYMATREESHDAFGWVNRKEKYFELKVVNGTERILAAMVAMEGKASTWYK